MGWQTFRALAAAVLAWLAFGAATPALAAQFAPGSRCHIAAGPAASWTQFASRPELWDCQPGDWSIASDRSILRFDLRGAAVRPVALSTRLSVLDAMRITVIAADGRRTTREYALADLTPSTSDWLMRAPLPALDGPLAAVIVEIDAVRHRGTLTDARLVASGERPANVRYELLVALVCGILLVPLLFNFMFYRVLRERFLFWHALAVTCMLVHTAITSGIVNRFVTLSIETLVLVSPLSWGCGIVAAALFSADLIEEDQLDPHHRAALRWIAPWILFWSLYYPLASGPLRASAATLYFLSFVPVIAMFVWVIAVAQMRGSRAVNFQIMAWLPIALTGLVRIVTTVVPGAIPQEMQLEQHIAIALEVLVTSLGVADRFMLIRTQRDRARALARRFEDMAERDPLTGLLNRRAIEERFRELHRAGFKCMAAIDLDRFKAINDAHGHAIGDDVLRATAAALSPDEDTLAVRMGGEEFLLLLRGPDAALRAERRRRAIPARIAADVTGLKGLVTASMGLVEHSDADAFAGDFMRAYEHCDRLLYEAKFAGRNRTMSAFVRHFDARLPRARAPWGPPASPAGTALPPRPGCAAPARSGG